MLCPGLCRGNRGHGGRVRCGAGRKGPLPRRSRTSAPGASSKSSSATTASQWSRMTVTGVKYPAPAPDATRPRLLFFFSPTSGRCRDVAGFLAYVLQRGHNHFTFALHHIDCEGRPALADRFAVSEPPVLVVVEGRRVRARLERPRGCREIHAFLAPWLR